MNIKILWVGKTKNSPIRSLLEDYLDRIRHMVSLEVIEVRDQTKARNLKGNQLVAAEEGEILRVLPGHGRVVILDERGTEFSSAELARWFESEQNRGTKEITFVVGGPDGIGSRISALAKLKLSLGKMTWTHEMCRVLLLEQVYRAFCILRNIPYHR
jgi:23S rRNA (pseudouridine1915-N3)-methyltransferase